MPAHLTLDPPQKKTRNQTCKQEFLPPLREKGMSMNMPTREPTS